MTGRDYTYAERNGRARARRKQQTETAAERIKIAERLIAAFGRWERASTPQEKRAARQWIRIYRRSFGLAKQSKEWRRLRKGGGAVMQSVIDGYEILGWCYEPDRMRFAAVKRA